MTTTNIISGLALLLLILFVLFLIDSIRKPSKCTSENPSPKPSPTPIKSPPEHFLGNGYVRTNIGTWTLPDYLSDSGHTAECPQCHTTNYLSLAWVEQEYSSARFHCPNCKTVWLDPSWATQEAIEFLLGHPTQSPSIEERVSNPDDARTVSPEIARLIREIRREENP